MLASLWRAKPRLRACPSPSSKRCRRHDKMFASCATGAQEYWGVQVTLGTAAPGDVAAKVLACPFSETHRRALSTPVQQRLPQFLVNEALGKGQPASEEDRQKWYLSFKGQTSVSLHFDSQRVRTSPFPWGWLFPCGCTSPCQSC